MSRHPWAALAVFATFTLAACGGGGKAESSADGQVTEPNATASSAPVAKSFEDLSKALQISVPDGYLRQPDEVGDTGPSNLDKAIADDGGADAGDVLTRTRFQRGYQRMWSRSDDDEIVVYVYQFADNAGAVEYTDRMIAADTNAGAQAAGVTIGRYGVPGIHGAVGVNASDATSATSSVSFVKGPYSVQMVVNAPTATGLQTLATALAEEQYSRL